MHNNYFGLEEEQGDRFLQEWQQSAKEARLDKLQAQVQNSKKMLSQMPERLDRGLPQLAHDPALSQSRRQDPPRLTGSQLGSAHKPASVYSQKQ